MSTVGFCCFTGKLFSYLSARARANRLIFIDEYGSGDSERVEDVHQYTVENMVEDVEAVRDELGLGKISLLGHSYGGTLAQAYWTLVTLAFEDQPKMWIERVRDFINQ